MTVENTKIDAVKLLKLFNAKDQRGLFVKPFQQSDLKKNDIDFTIKESIYSISNQHVFRGMHFHHPPYDHAKIVFCTQGSILDIVLDLRKNEPTYGEFVQYILSDKNMNAIYIPKGFAHGFLSLENNTTAFYFIDGEYHANADDGILYNSFGHHFDLEDIIISDRDLSFQTFNKFISPF